MKTELIISKHQLNNLINYKDERVFCYILTNHRDLYNQIVLVYLYFFNQKKQYSIILKHGEINTKLQKEDIDSFLNSLSKNNTLFTNKQIFNKFFTLDNNILDLDLLMWINNNIIINDFYNALFSIYYRNYNHIDNINLIIPLYTHIQRIQKIKSQFISNYKEEYQNNSQFIFYNNNVLPIFQKITNSKIYYNNSFIQILYKFNSINGRPSCYHNKELQNTNILTLPKDDINRKRFKSRFQNGVLVQIDYHAYHLRLISELIQFKFKSNTSNLYQYFAKHFYPEKLITQAQINNTKSMMFRMMYGFFDQNRFKNHQFFVKLKQFINNLWKQYCDNDKQYLPLINRKIKHIQNKQKLFNYLIVNIQLKYFIPKLQKILKILDKYNSKLILYKFDSILLDVDLSQKQIVKKIKIIMQEDNYNTSISIGKNYFKMKKL